jgi:hypothetical protein
VLAALAFSSSLLAQLDEINIFLEIVEILLDKGEIL